MDYVGGFEGTICRRFSYFVTFTRTFCGVGVQHKGISRHKTGDEIEVKGGGKVLSIECSVLGPMRLANLAVHRTPVGRNLAMAKAIFCQIEKKPIAAPAGGTVAGRI